jgi:hypothetical protein
LEVKDRTNEDWYSLVDAERERPWRRPIPQHLEGKNLHTPISIVCQFSSNYSIKLLPKRVAWCIRNSINTNRIANGFFSSIFCSDIHQKKFTSLTLSVYTNKNNLSINTEEIPNRI